jgi:hypothetical protein
MRNSKGAIQESVRNHWDFADDAASSTYLIMYRVIVIFALTAMLS